MANIETIFSIMQVFYGLFSINLMTAIERLFQYFEYQGIKHTSFEKEIGLSNGYFNKMRQRKASIGSEIIEKIVLHYEKLNPIWLLTGKGEMIVGEKKYAEMSDNTHLNIASDHKPAYNSDLVAYLERKLDEKTRECYDLQAKIEGLASELRRRKEAPAQEQPLADVG